MNVLNKLRESFSSLMNIDKLILAIQILPKLTRFSSLMNIDKLILNAMAKGIYRGFSSLMNIDKLIQKLFRHS